MAMSRLASRAFSVPRQLVTMRLFQVLPAAMLEQKYDAEKMVKSDFIRKKHFRSYLCRDTNKDGFLSRSDYDLVIQTHKDMRTPNEKVQQLKKVLDGMCDSIGLTDNSVIKTYDECNRAWMERTKEMGVTSFQFEAHFDALDLNNDGCISLDEWIRHYKAMAIDPKYAKDSFNAMDTDHDGLVSKKEFVDYHMEYFYSDEDNLNSSILFGPTQ